jgi:hypothetical protein
VRKESYKNIVNEIPIDLLKNSISLEELGIYELAWKRESAIKVIDNLFNNEYLILGGDVYSIKQEVNLTYDNWFIVHEGQDMDKFATYTKQKAVKYINDYYNLNGDEFCYSIVSYKIKDIKISVNNI